jgi:hypothetical protein
MRTSAFHIIQKTRVFNHRIPITQEVPTVVLAQIAWVMQQYTPEEILMAGSFQPLRKN